MTKRLPTPFLFFSPLLDDGSIRMARLSCRLIPITDRSIGLVEAIIIPADDPVAQVQTAPRLQLSPDGKGALVGDLERDMVVTPGDVVRLADSTWPDGAQGMIVGFVESVEPKDLQPLLSSVTVRPRYHPQRLASVTLKIERRAGGTGGEGR